MKIIKKPLKITEIIVCDCGCEFEIDIDDLVINERLNVGLVDCPICHQTHKIDNIHSWGNGYIKENEQ